LPAGSGSYSRIGEDLSYPIENTGGALQEIDPTLFPHSNKAYGKSGKLQLTQQQIQSGHHADYTFEVRSAFLLVGYKGTKLGAMTITMPKTGQLLKVGELDVGTQFRGINLSRILMIMLAQTVIAQGGTKYSVGNDTDITNAAFWNQYSSNVTNYCSGRSSTS